MRFGRIMTVSGSALATALAAVRVAADEGMWLPIHAREIGNDLRKAGLAFDSSALADLQSATMKAILSPGGRSAMAGSCCGR